MNEISMDDSVREPALAGLCYPEDPDELHRYLESLFRHHSTPSGSPDKAPIKGLFAPHIDPRIADKCYAAAFNRLRNQRPKRVVILATAHYTGYAPQFYMNYPFIGTRRTFRLPHGAIDIDHETMERLSELGNRGGYTDQDLAHGPEHSIELHLLFARYIWPHQFTIVPILVNSFDQLYYMENGHLNEQIETFTASLKELDSKDTLYLISGDLSHIGPKFGDYRPARTMIDRVESYDRTFLQIATRGESGSLLRHISDQYDPYRVCGFPPLYTFLKLGGKRFSGSLVNYDLWDDEDYHSMVTFGSMIYSESTEHAS